MTTLSDDERRQRVLSHIREQTQKGIPHMKALMREEWDRQWALIQGLRQAQANFKPGPDEFSIAQVVSHNALTDQRYGERIAGLAGGQIVEPPISRGMLPPDEGAPFQELRQQCREVRLAIMTAVEGRDPSANLELKVVHPFFGPLNWQEWLVLLKVHGSDHTQQMEAISASPGFPKN